MFGLFGKKKVKPKTLMDKFIHVVYGNPPPKKTAVLNDAIEIAYDKLLMGLVNKNEIAELAGELFAGPVPYSTHDLALSVALNFFRQEKRMQDFYTAQLMARVQMLEWVKEGKVNITLVKAFENTLYTAYKVIE